MATSPAAGRHGCGRALEALIELTHPDSAPDLAKQLLARFGSFAAAPTATPGARSAILDSTPSVEQTFRTVWLAVDHMLRSRLARRPILSNKPALLDYLRFAMAFDPVERFRILFLNATNELVADELMAIGTAAAVQIFPREVVKRCLEIGATAMLLVHNHPSGNPIPSAADRAMTRRLAQAARYFDIMIHDHLVIARDGVTSFRREGYL